MRLSNNIPLASPDARSFGWTHDLFVRSTAVILVVGISFLSIYKFGLLTVTGGVLGAAVLGLLAAKPDLATLAVMFVMYSNAAAVAVRSHEGLAPLAVGFFLLLCLPLFNFVVFRREGMRTDAILRWMMLYFVIMAISTIFSRTPSDSTKTIVEYVFQGIVVYFLIINTVRSPVLLRKILWIMVLTGATFGALSWFQDFTETYQNPYGGFAVTEVVGPNGEVIRSEIDTGEEKRGQDVSRGRASGPIKDPNFYGQILVTVLPFALVFAFTDPSRRMRLLAATACVLIMAGIVLSFSRGAAIAVIVVGASLFFLHYFKLRYALLFAAGIVLIIAANPAYRYRLGTLSGLGSSQMRATEPSMKERSRLLRAGVEVFFEHPLLGVGAGQSPNYIQSTGATGFSAGARGIPLHNTYLQQLVETGVLGFFCFMTMAFLILRNLLRVSRYWIGKRPEYAHLATALFLSVVAYMTTNLFLHLAFIRYYWLFLGLSGAAVLALQPPSEDHPC
jgi:hypothetical protein